MTEFTDLQKAHHALMFYTLEHAKHDPSFIHQLGVDASAAYYADEQTKPITLAFALIGLYLHIEHAYTGKQVQDAHIVLAKKRKQWPKFSLPKDRGSITIEDVLRSPEGNERDEMLKKWCVSVWNAYTESHDAVRELVASS